MTLAQKYNEVVNEIEASSEYKAWISELENLIQENQSSVDLEYFSAYFWVATYMNGSSAEAAHDELESMFLDY